MDNLREPDPDNAPFKWIRAPEDQAARTRRTRAIAGVVFVAACFGVGLALGLVSIGLQTPDRQHQTSVLKEPANEPVPKPSDSDPPKSVATTEASSPPSLALGSGPEPSNRKPESKSAPGDTAAVNPAPETPVILLNPGAADGGAKNEQQVPSQSFRISVPQEPTSQEGHNPTRMEQAPSPRARAAPGMAKDYRALRDDVLRR